MPRFSVGPIGAAFFWVLLVVVGPVSEPGGRAAKTWVPMVSGETIRYAQWTDGFRGVLAGPLNGAESGEKTPVNPETSCQKSPGHKPNTRPAKHRKP